MDQVRSELALANAQELINVKYIFIFLVMIVINSIVKQKINEKCYLKCVPKPGPRLESGEQACLSKCMDRYMEAWNVVSRAYINRLQREQQGGSL